MKTKITIVLIKGKSKTLNIEHDNEKEIKVLKNRLLQCKNVREVKLK